MWGMDGIGRGEVAEVYNVNSGLHDIAEMEIRRAQDLAQVLHHAARLVLDPALDQPSAGRVDSDLPRAEEPFAVSDRLRIGPDRGRRRGRRNLLFHRLLRMRNLREKN